MYIPISMNMIAKMMFVQVNVSFIILFFSLLGEQARGFLAGLLHYASLVDTAPLAANSITLTLLG
jgi:hypothetical protein